VLGVAEQDLIPAQFEPLAPLVGVQLTPLLVVAGDTEAVVPETMLRSLKEQREKCQRATDFILSPGLTPRILKTAFLVSRSTWMKSSPPSLKGMGGMGLSSSSWKPSSRWNPSSRRMETSNRTFSLLDMTEDFKERLFAMAAEEMLRRRFPNFQSCS
jgi:hypothetical protein